MSEFQMPAWRDIPDLGLYMDQVLIYVQRVYADLYGEETVKKNLTAAMINNYVKAKLIARPAGKKYGREQLASILLIVQLKGVLSLDMIRLLLASQPMETLYARYSQMQSDAMRAFDALDPLSAAAEACMHALACERLLSRANREEEIAE